MRSDRSPRAAGAGPPQGHTACGAAPRLVVDAGDAPHAAHVAVGVAPVQLVAVVEPDAHRQRLLRVGRPLRGGRGPAGGHVLKRRAARQAAWRAVVERASRPSRKPGGNLRGEQAASQPGGQPTSRIFLAQYMRMKPCILPVATISSCAAFHSLSCVCARSNCSLRHGKAGQRRRVLRRRWRRAPAAGAHRRRRSRALAAPSPRRRRHALTGCTGARACRRRGRPASGAPSRMRRPASRSCRRRSSSCLQFKARAAQIDQEKESEARRRVRWLNPTGSRQVHGAPALQAARGQRSETAAAGQQGSGGSGGGRTRQLAPHDQLLQEPLDRRLRGGQGRGGRGTDKVSGGCRRALGRELQPRAHGAQRSPRRALCTFLRCAASIAARCGARWPKCR